MRVSSVIDRAGAASRRARRPPAARAPDHPPETVIAPADTASHDGTNERSNVCQRHRPKISCSKTRFARVTAANFLIASLHDTHVANSSLLLELCALTSNILAVSLHKLHN